MRKYPALALLMLLCLPSLAGAQSMPWHPHLDEQYADGAVAPAKPAIHTLYVHYCPFCAANRQCWLLWEDSSVDDDPEYLEYDTNGNGFQHWHDASFHLTRWFCECGHLFSEYANNGPCWCGWQREPGWRPVEGDPGWQPGDDDDTTDDDDDDDDEGGGPDGAHR